MFNNTTKVQSLKNKSIKILSIFTSTLQNLHLVNQEIEVEMEDRKAQIEVLRVEGEELDLQFKNNEKVIERISHFIE